MWRQGGIAPMLRYSGHGKCERWVLQLVFIKVFLCFIANYICILVDKVLNILCVADEQLVQYRIELKEWNEIEHLIAFFKPFAEVTTFMTGQNYPTISGVILLFNSIMDHLDKYRLVQKNLKVVIHLPEKIKEAAEASYQKMLKYYNRTNEIHCVVALLDPRLNKGYFQNSGFTSQMIGDYVER